MATCGRPFIHIKGSVAAKQIAFAAFKSAAVALTVGGSINYFIFGQQKKDIAAFYKNYKVTN